MTTVLRNARAGSGLDARPHRRCGSALEIIKAARSAERRAASFIGRGSAPRPRRPMYHFAGPRRSAPLWGDGKRGRRAARRPLPPGGGALAARALDIVNRMAARVWL